MAMKQHAAFFTYDDEAFDQIGEHLYYFAPTKRAPPPYKRQVHVEAILDIAEDGTLAGIELVHGDLPPPPKQA